MMREQGRIVDLQGRYAIVSSTRKSACGGCNGESSCGTLSGGLGKKPVLFRALNHAEGKVGDEVVLEISERAFLNASFLAYGLPMLAMIFTGLIVRGVLLSSGSELDTAEGLGAVSGLFAMGGTFALMRKYNATLEQQDSRLPVVAQVMRHAAIPIMPAS
uniref:Putative positive regulator of sigma(E), RseC/MucC n=1 Tax=Magnetococcus massalia (strain MO-1) TaxID=451514 RepID=A0A1S7LIE8_MAGMO|nr:Putative positive regulator of sigma(E), RseC/MucC [Candidatus Magnetococcus massalia]